MKNIISILQKPDDSLQIARWLMRQNDLSTYPAKFLVELHAKFPLRFLILGGEPDFLYPLRQNLDAETGPLNPFDFTFDRDHILPVKSGSCEIVYVRSAIDPLDEPSAKRLVEEAARVVAKDGALVMSSSKFTDQALAGLVSDNGMTVLSKDRARVISRFNHIPRIAIDAESRNFVFAVCKGKRREI